MKSILVLEDEPCVMSVLKEILKQYSVLQATTAEEALQRFSDCDFNVDLLIADLSLPTQSGIQVAHLFREWRPSLPVILTSGYPRSSWSDQDSRDLEKLGTSSLMVLDKPFMAKALLDAVHGLIGLPQPEKASAA